MSIFSERVKELISKMKITQKELSKLSGVSEPSLCRYLKGQMPRQDVINNVAEALGVSSEYLLGGVQEKQEEPYVLTRAMVMRHRGQLTAQQKAELINMLFEKDEK